MNKITLTILSCLFYILASNAQNDLLASYNWEENPVKNFNADDYQNKDLVALKEKRISEFAFLDNAGLIENLLIHNIYWLNSNEIIESYNKVYLPELKGARLLKNKARVISKEGKIIELDDSKILESKDNERQTVRQYFAMEGIQKGDFIEYYYIIQKYPNYTGKRVFLQDDYLIKEVNFEVYAPSNLKFAFKTYNDTLQVERDTLVKDRNHWVLNLKDVNVLEEEESAPYLNLLKQVNFKLDRNYAAPNKEIVSFGNIAQNIYTKYYVNAGKKAKSKVDKLLKKLEITEATESNIRQLENYIKSTIYLNKSSANPNLSDLVSVLETNIANDIGVLSLFIQAFENIGLEHELVLTSDRKNYFIDESFESYDVLQDYLFYFPKFKTYLQPLDYGYRYGFPNGMLMDNKGLFVKKISIGGFESAIGEVKYIEGVNYDKSVYDLDMKVTFDSENINQTKIELDRIMSGYYALGIQPYFEFMKEENKKETLENIVKSIKDDIEILEVQTSNTKPSDFGTAPFTVTAKATSESFVENAGKNYLFKIGELIGPQLEMYQDKERKSIVHSDFERSYHSTIKVKIPEGFTLKNLEDIAMNEFYEENGEMLFKFQSSYVIDDNNLTVTINEFYNKNIIELSIYESYRKVINSAANFNKVVLVLLKEES